MDVHKLKDLSIEDRQSVLQGEALAIEEQVYMRPLTEEEIGQKKDELVQASLLKAVIEEELKNIKEEFKAKIEPLKDQITDSLTAIKNKAIESKGQVYRLPDYDNQMIHTVDNLGIVLSSRRMLPEERQFRIQHAKAV